MACDGFERAGEFLDSVDESIPAGRSKQQVRRVSRLPSRHMSVPRATQDATTTHDTLVGHPLFGSETSALLTGLLLFDVLFGVRGGIRYEDAWCWVGRAISA